MSHESFRESIEREFRMCQENFEKLEQRVEKLESVPPATPQGPAPSPGEGSLAPANPNPQEGKDQAASGREIRAEDVRFDIYRDGTGYKSMTATHIPSGETVRVTDGLRSEHRAKEWALEALRAKVLAAQRGPA